MKIKKRLFISNIMMVVIPVAVSVATVFLCLAIFLAALFHGKAYEITDEDELHVARAMLIENVEGELDGLADGDGQVRLQKMEPFINANHMVLSILDGGKEVLRLGSEALTGESDLREAVLQVGGDGLAANENTEAYGKQMDVQGRNYQILLYNGKFYMSEQMFKSRIFLVFLLMMISIVLVVYVTNRFLTGFVFRRIEEPLEVLAGGVREIRDGNLKHRIIYEAEDEFRPVCEDFNDMAGRLELSVTQIQKNEQSRKELLASISHDLRSPLTSIKAYVEGLSDGIASTPESKKRYLKTIQAKTDDIDHLVAKLFLFSKMDMGDYPDYPEELDAGEEINDFVEASREDYLNRGLDVKVRDDLTGNPIYVDPTQFRSILANLLDNSVKYKNKDRGSATIGGGVTDGGMLRLVVEDDGPGVPEEALDKLFNVFYRNDPSRTSPNKGSGLGLAIVAKELERMKGSIKAYNRPSGGLSMVIEIPLAKGAWKG